MRRVGGLYLIAKSSFQVDRKVRIVGLSRKAQLYIACVNQAIKPEFYELIGMKLKLFINIKNLIKVIWSCEYLVSCDNRIIINRYGFSQDMTTF